MELRGAVLDVDGTLVRGDDPVPGAVAGHDALVAAGVDRLYVSNNPTRPPADYVDRLGGAGFDVAAEQVLTSGTLTTTYLRERHPEGCVHVVGEAGLREQLRAADLALTPDPSAASVIVVSLDRSFDYGQLTETFRALSDPGCAFVGTDPDMVIPAPEGDVPGSGAIINAIAGVAGREPGTVAGKPSAHAADAVRQRLGHPPEACLVVGDRLDTDVALGERAGMRTALVRTGVTQNTDDAAVTPDHVLDSLAGVADLLDGDPAG